MAEGEGRALTIFFDRPAGKWEEGFPVGNGRLGAMVFGGVPRERLQLNEDSPWSGGPIGTHNPEARAALLEVRRLLAEGRQGEAEALAERALRGRPSSVSPYQTLGEIEVECEGHARPAQYRRELDLDTAIVTTSYVIHGARLTREAFASYSDRVLAVRLSCDRPGLLSAAVSLTRGQEAETETRGADGLVLRGRLDAGEGLRFCARLQARVEGGEVAACDGRLIVTGAEAVTLLLTAQTSLRTEHPEVRCEEQLAGPWRRAMRSCARLTWPITRRCSDASSWFSNRRGWAGAISTPYPQGTVWAS